MLYNRRLFLLYVWLQINAAAAQLQLHPKFSVRDIDNGNNNYFLGSTESSAEWKIGDQTGLYMLLHGKNDASLADHSMYEFIRIENLPHSESSSLKIHINFKCTPNDPGSTLEFKYPFTIADVELCKDLGSLPIMIKQVKYSWTDDVTIELKFQLTMFNDSQVLFRDVLKHYFRIQFEFVGSNWRLVSNGLFLRNWDSIWIFGNTQLYEKLYELHFMTNDAFDLMMYANFSSYSGYQTLQFLHQDVSKIISEASEFAQSTIGIGAILGINHVCSFLEPYKTMAFMSVTYSELYQYPSHKLMRLDATSGLIEFSRYGLGKMANDLTQNSSFKEEGDYQFADDSLCPLLSFSSLRLDSSYSANLTFNTARFYDTYQGIRNEKEPVDDCHVLTINTNKNTTVFVRAARSYVFCPIICAGVDQEYKFHKHGVELIPNPNVITFSYIRDTGIGIHQSGVALHFTESATQEDAGEYSCKAGGKEAKINVEIVSLPEFNVKAARDWPDGSLPPRIYAPVRGSYTARCTVYYTGMQTVTVTPVFYVMVNKRNASWTKMTFDDFKNSLKYFDSKAEMTTSKTPYSTTLTLSVWTIPIQTNVFDFSHRFICNASVSRLDAQRFGLPEYFTQTGSDVLVVPPPTRDSIVSWMERCCDYGCFGRDCMVNYTLSKEMQLQLKMLHIDIVANFVSNGSELDETWQKRVSYDKSSATLTYRSKENTSDMSEKDKMKFLQLVPEFKLYLSDWKKFSIKNVIITSSTGIHCSTGNSCLIFSWSGEPIVTLGWPELSKAKPLELNKTVTHDRGTEKPIVKVTNETYYSFMLEMLKAGSSGNAASSLKTQYSWSNLAALAALALVLWV